jgi:hypothetical protein
MQCVCSVYARMGEMGWERDWTGVFITGVRWRWVFWGFLLLFVTDCCCCCYRCCGVSKVSTCEMRFSNVCLRLRICGFKNTLVCAPVSPCVYPSEYADADAAADGGFIIVWFLVLYSTFVSSPLLSGSLLRVPCLSSSCTPYCTYIHTPSTVPSPCSKLEKDADASASASASAGEVR